MKNSNITVYPTGTKLKPIIEIDTLKKEITVKSGLLKQVSFPLTSNLTAIVKQEGFLKREMILMEGQQALVTIDNAHGEEEINRFKSILQHIKDKSDIPDSLKEPSNKSKTFSIVNTAIGGFIGAMAIAALLSISSAFMEGFEEGASKSNSVAKAKPVPEIEKYSGFMPIYQCEDIVRSKLKYPDDAKFRGILDGQEGQAR